MFSKDQAIWTDHSDGSRIVFMGTSNIGLPDEVLSLCIREYPSNPDNYFVNVVQLKQQGNTAEIIKEFSKEELVINGQDFLLPFESRIASPELGIVGPMKAEEIDVMYHLVHSKACDVITERMLKENYEAILSELEQASNKKPTEAANDKKVVQLRPRLA